MHSCQRTLRRSFELAGIGLHLGAQARVKVEPAPVGSGIVFVRADGLHAKPVAALFHQVTETRLATTLGSGEFAVSTVEHLLAAFAGMGVDNARVLVFGPEVPILDGSSLPFVQAIQEAGLVEQEASRRVLKVLKRVRVQEGDRWAQIEPGEGFEVSARIVWDHPSIRDQAFDFDARKMSFDEIAPARTFGFIKDLDGLHQMGLVQGASLENVIGLSSEAVLNEEGLRFADEFVRHKILDAMGDLVLTGFPIQGKVTLFKSGHELHRRLVSELLRDRRNYAWSGQDARSEVVEGSGIISPLVVAAARAS